ncbi:MAG: DUF2007 domain-containing protein [Gammaproteobacteria bacterium]|nr:MAG: hypothetical protein AMJ59_13960 [Gammaproteobacteria bacterium SG8_31]
MQERSRMVCVHRLQDPIEANLVRGLLVNEGIPVELTGEGLVGAYSGVPKLCEVRVMVPPDFRSSARKILDRYESEKGKKNTSPDWSCTACGEINDPSFEICWRCGEGR